MCFKPAATKTSHAKGVVDFFIGITFAVQNLGLKKLLLAILLLGGLQVFSQPAADTLKTVSAPQQEAYRGIWPLVSWVSADAPEARAVRPFSRPGTGWKTGLAAGLLLLLGLLRRIFEKYYTDLMGLMFRSTVKSRQIREQMQNKPLQSLSFNIFFFISGGVFLYLLAGYYSVVNSAGAWVLLLCAGALAAVYLVKFIILKFFGWLFNSSQITSTYIFVVFYINKILGIFLAPVVVIMLLAGSQLSDILVIVSLLGVALLFFYRYILVYNPAWKAVQMPVFHFFLYICGVEIAPLLLIYKVLFQMAEKNL